MNKLSSFLEKISPIRNSSILKFLDFVNRLVFILAHLCYPLYLIFYTYEVLNAGSGYYQGSGDLQWTVYLVSTVYLLLLRFIYRVTNMHISILKDKYKD